MIPRTAFRTIVSQRSSIHSGLLLKRAICSSIPQYDKVKLWEHLPGEGGEVNKGLSELMGPLRAKNFANPNPKATVGYDHFDVAIGKIHTVITIFLRIQ